MNQNNRQIIELSEYYCNFWYVNDNEYYLSENNNVKFVVLKSEHNYIFCYSFAQNNSY
jgi:hypothetical protein